MAKEAVSAAVRAVSVTERAVLLDGRAVAKKTVSLSCRAVSVIKLNFYNAISRIIKIHIMPVLSVITDNMKRAHF